MRCAIRQSTCSFFRWLLLLWCGVFNDTLLGFLFFSVTSGVFICYFSVFIYMKLYRSQIVNLSIFRGISLSNAAFACYTTGIMCGIVEGRHNNTEESVFC